MLYPKERQNLANVINELRILGILNPEGGGIVVRIGNGNILASPTGAAFRLWKVEPKDILVTNKDGYILEKGNYLAIAEFSFDLHILSNFPLANAIFHVHGPYSLAFASKRKSIPCSTNHVEILGKVPCLESPDETGLKREYLKNPFPVNMPKAVIQRPEVFLVFRGLVKEFDHLFKSRAGELENHGLAFTVEKHGLFVFAKTLEEAIENAVRVEGAARTALFGQLIKE